MTHNPFFDSEDFPETACVTAWLVLTDVLENYRPTGMLGHQTVITMETICGEFQISLMG